MTSVDEGRATSERSLIACLSFRARRRDLVSCGGALVAAVVAWVLLPRRDVLLADVDSHMTAE